VRNKKPLPLLEDVEIIDVGSEGKSVARVDNYVVFTEHVAPGDIVDIQVYKKKSSYMEGRVVNIKKKSENRAEPFCEHFGRCGGCKWQILPYDQQLIYKRRHVKNALKRIGHLEIPRIAPIIGSEDITFYRNKLEFSFCMNRWLEPWEMETPKEELDRRAAGFNIQGRFDKVLDVKKCWLQPEPSNSLRLETRKFSVENDISFFEIVKQTGLLRSMYVRTSSTGEVMCIVVFFYNDEEKISALMTHLTQRFPEVTSMLYVVNGKGNTILNDCDIHLWAGKDHIYEEMEGLKFKISPKSFYQTNSKQAYNLYKATRELAGLTGDELVYDLYTGTGTIANFVARMCKHVIGVEFVEDAIADARINSEINGITNTEFYAGDMKEILNREFLARHGKPDVIITDPPRAGMHLDVINTILEADAPKVVYVSCNPATQARDLELMAHKYKITRVQPVDMFPHTAHVENIVLLEKI